MDNYFLPGFELEPEQKLEALGYNAEQIPDILQKEVGFNSSGIKTFAISTAIIIGGAVSVSAKAPVYLKDILNKPEILTETTKNVGKSLKGKSIVDNLLSSSTFIDGLFILFKVSEVQELKGQTALLQNEITNLKSFVEHSHAEQKKLVQLTALYGGGIGLFAPVLGQAAGWVFKKVGGAILKRKNQKKQNQDETLEDLGNFFSQFSKKQEEKESHEVTKNLFLNLFRAAPYGGLGLALLKWLRPDLLQKVNQPLSYALNTIFHKEKEKPLEWYQKPLVYSYQFVKEHPILTCVGLVVVWKRKEIYRIFVSKEFRSEIFEYLHFQQNHMKDFFEKSQKYMQDNVEYYRKQFSDQVQQEQVRLNNAESVIQELQADVQDKVQAIHMLEKAHLTDSQEIFRCNKELHDVGAQLNQTLRVNDKLMLDRENCMSDRENLVNYFNSAQVQATLEGKPALPNLPKVEPQREQIVGPGSYVSVSNYAPSPIDTSTPLSVPTKKLEQNKQSKPTVKSKK